MEKNGKITLIDKELSEGQQKLSRFIEYYTHIPFTGETYNEWSMWVALNKEYAEHEKAKQTDQKAEEEKPVKKYKNRDRKRGREIAVDCAGLYGAIKSIGETNGHICALCGFGHAYLSDVKRRGWMYESDIEKLSDAGIDAADYVTDEWYRAKYLTEEEPVAEEQMFSPVLDVNELKPLTEETEMDMTFDMVVKALKLEPAEIRAFTTQAAFTGIHPLICLGAAVMTEAADINERLIEIFGEVKEA